MFCLILLRSVSLVTVMGAEIVLIRDMVDREESRNRYLLAWYGAFQA